MSYPPTVTLVCADVVPDLACDGPLGATFLPIADTLASDWVLYGMTAGSCALNWSPVFALPQGAYLYTSGFDRSSPTGGQCQPASMFTFGNGAAFTPPFDVSQLNSVQVGEAFAAGFLLVAGAFLLGMPVRMLLGVIKR